MLLKQKFKTLAGVSKRCAFENTHKTPGNKNMHYYVVWFLCGRRVDQKMIPPGSLAKPGLVHWQIEKVSIKK